MTEKNIVTASQVRQWLVSHPASLNSLSEAERKTVVPNSEGQFPKGRLARKAINVHNSRNRTGQYVDGATREAAAQAAREAKAARKAAARKATRKGVTIGKRGPLPKAFVSVPKS